jgi:FkbM family methyltransferase
MEEETPDGDLSLRLAIWREFKRRGLTTPVEIPWVEDLKLSVTLGNDLSRCMYVCRSFEPNDFAFQAGYLQPGMVALDIGANEGAYTLFASRRVGSTGRVLAFEPSSREYARLIANIELNSLPNVSAFAIGLADREGEGTLRVAEDEHAGLNTLGLFVHKTEQARCETIALQRLDSIVAEERIDRLDFIKMDVEGAEFAVLSGASDSLAHFKPVVQLELLEGALQAQGSSGTEVLRLLGAMGYRFYETSTETGQPRPFTQGSAPLSNLIAVPNDRRPSVMAGM